MNVGCLISLMDDWDVHLEAAVHEVILKYNDRKVKNELAA